MKVEKSLNKIIIYLYDNMYIKEDIKKLIIDIFDILSKYYSYELKSSYNIKMYINKYYGIIIEIEEKDLNNKKEVNINLKVLKDTPFLYKVNDPLYYKKEEIYLYNDEYYVNKKNMDIKIYENSKLIYGNEVYKIIGKGIKI